MAGASVSLSATKQDINYLRPFTQPLSAETEAYITKFVQDYLSDDPSFDLQAQQYKIYAASVYGKEKNPIFKYYVALENPKIIIINEDWFARLTDSEKRFVLGKNFFKLYRSADTVMQRANRNKLFLLGVLSIAELGVGIGVYKFLDHNRGYVQRQFSRLTRGLIGYLAAATMSITVSSFFLKRFDEKQIFALTEQVIEKFNCLDGALGVYKQMQYDLAPYAQVVYWKETYAFINKIVPHLERLKAQKEELMLKS
jgi:hypothetical protein